MVVVVGVGCLGLNLVQRSRAAEAHLLHVLKGLTRTPQVEEEVGDDLVQHPDVLLGEVAAVGRLGVRGEHALAGPRGAARTPAVWDLGPAAPRRDGVHERVVVCRRAAALCPHKFLYVAAEGVDGLVCRRGII